VLSVAVPVAAVILALFAIWTAMIGERDPFHGALLTSTGAVLLLSVLLAAAGVSMAICLVVVACTPVVTVIDYEAIGHRHLTDAPARLEPAASSDGGAGCLA
jgi:hypothetical protein